MRKTNQAGVELIKEFEGVRRTAYLDPIGILTVGVGHVVQPRDGIKLGNVISDERVDEFLHEDLAKTEAGVEAALIADLTDNQFAACVALAFNIGVGAFKKSSIARNINAGLFGPAADSFLLYNKAGGQILPGLTRRRKAERALFLTSDEPADEPAEPSAEPVATEASTSSTVIKKSTEIISNLAGNEQVKQVASEGVTKLAVKAASAMGTASTVSATGGTATHNPWLFVFAIVLGIAAAGIIVYVLVHKSRKEIKAAEIAADPTKHDVHFQQ